MLKCCGIEALMAVMCRMAEGRKKSKAGEKVISLRCWLHRRKQRGTAARYSRSTLAAKIKSLSVSPSILWVKTVSPTLPQLR